MNRATQLALSRINERFYAHIAADWQHKRKHPWPGFARIWQLCLAADSGTTHVLDVGCGDGRFAQFLADQQASQHGPLDLRYLGLDNSTALLAAATQRKLSAAFRFQHADLVTAPLAQQPQQALITVLGVLHHIPGRAQRSALLRTLGAQLQPGGHLVLTIWRLDEDPRFASRNVSFEDYNRTAVEPIALDQLEPGDTLLRWDAQQDTPRYCHFPSEAELADMLDASGLEARERYRADGHQSRMNEYVVLRAR
jgi:tRNA (uracil-5-)-methyltransferase TRM9